MSWQLAQNLLKGAVGPSDFAGALTKQICNLRRAYDEKNQLKISEAPTHSRRPQDGHSADNLDES